MSDATRLVAKAARESVQDIVERYEGYQAHLVTRFVAVLQIQHAEPSNKARRREIEKLVMSFASEVSARLEDAE